MLDIIWENVMKKIFSIAVLGSLAVMPVWAGSWGAMHTSTCGGANEYYRLDNAGRYCLECDDDEGDAAAKTRVYWENGEGRVRTRKCYISPYLDGDDKWTDAEWPKQCANNKCPSGQPVVKLPTPHTKYNTYICGKANRPVKSWYDSALVSGGTSDSMDCYFTACDENNPVGSKRDVSCTASQDPNAKSCEEVCFAELNAYGLGRAEWKKFVKECPDGYKLAGEYRGYYTKCEKEAPAVVCPDGSSKDVLSQDKCTADQVFSCALNNTEGKCLCGKCVDSFTCPEGSSKDVLSQAACSGKDVFTCKHKDPAGKCLCGKCAEPQESSLDRCLKSRSTAEGKACCYLPNRVATWDGAQCSCVGDGMEFKIGPDGRGTCNAKAPEQGAAFDCNPAILSLVQTWGSECAIRKPSVTTMAGTIAVLCASDTRTYEEFNIQYTALLAMNPGDCAESAARQQQEQVANSQVAVKAVTDAVARLDSIVSTLEVSKWKDAEGKFNTARLASDSIAGVVLGTAGGLITSSVVKKHQVEEGFEDLQCVIGGQTVAGWGDEFTVGVQ